MTRSLFHSKRQLELYDYAIGRALSVLVRNAGWFGRGWYHLADGELIVAVEIAL